MNSRQQIESLIYGYARMLDEGDLEGVARLFEAGRLVTKDGRVLADGEQELLELYRDLVRIYPETGTPRTQHVMSNLTLDIDEDAGHATGRCQYTVFQQTDALPLQCIITGTYFDTFERPDGQWQFKERKTVGVLFGDLSHHLLKNV